jgi:outer membrane protein OmpA-like peptidoglycan-associated protein
MKRQSIHLAGIAASLCAGALLTGCASTPPANTELTRAQLAYSSASSDSNVVQAAPAQLRKASVDIDQATALQKDGAAQVDVDHYAYLAIQEIGIAQQLASADSSQAYIKQAGTQRNQMLLQASQQQTQQAQMRTQDAEVQAKQAQIQADTANAAAQDAHTQAAAVTAQAGQYQQQNAVLQQQLATLNAKQTNRGMVLTLGSVLFDVNKTNLKPGGTRSLDKLAQFMQNNPKRNVMVEGYTDSSGSTDANLALSQRRADAVQSALISNGITPQRITTKGYGVEDPVAGKASKSGRQQNRRVEIVISDANGDFSKAR